jgi:hypothetical protein
MDAHAEGKDEEEKADRHDAQERPADRSHHRGSSHQAGDEKAAPGATVHR